MKKLLLLSLMIISSLVCSAQGIYTSIIKFDKFDDIVWRKNVKTLITKTDSTFIIETKGQKPEEYYYSDSYLMASHIGSKDSIVNLIENVWGYEDFYFIYTPKDIEECIQEANNDVKDLPDSLVFDGKIKMLMAYHLIQRTNNLPTLHIRNISKYSYRYEYGEDALWIKFKDGSRIIYTKR